MGCHRNRIGIKFYSHTSKVLVKFIVYLDKNTHCAKCVAILKPNTFARWRNNALKKVCKYVRNVIKKAYDQEKEYSMLDISVI